ncbi:epidermal retinol dehydrogenase 2-like [Periplaneta americana]|uniref:epidermal retinol dehydrogenase 2-like n=1 Tax=Periplaneta americana TaxID=6978 RepID=UPI0037E7B71F
MLLRVYSLLVLMYDVMALFFLVVTAGMEAFYHLFFPPHQKSVAGEIVLIAGAGRGLGRELAIQFSMLGATVVCWDIRADSNEETAIKADSLGYGVGKAYAYTCDITDREQVMKTAERMKREVGAVTVVVNCCNLPSPRVLTERPVPEVRKTMDVGVLSHLWILQTFLPSMQEKKHGHIVMLTSVAGLTGIRDLVPLSAAQFAVQGLAESLNEELRSYKPSGDVRLTLVHIYPFIVNKEMAAYAQLRIPSYFGTIDPTTVARKIIDAMRRDYVEVSIPSYLLYIGKVVSLLPRKAIYAMRELLDTGVDFG